MGRPPSPQQIHQKLMCMWNSSTGHLLDARRGSRTSRKANQSPQSEVGEKLKTKRDTKAIRLGTCTPGEWVLKEKSPYTRKPPHRRVQLWNLRGQGNSICSEGKMERLHTEIMRSSTSQLRTGSHAHARCGEWGWVGEAQVLRPGPQGETQGWLPWRYSDGTEATQMLLETQILPCSSCYLIIVHKMWDKKAWPCHLGSFALSL